MRSVFIGLAFVMLLATARADEFYLVGKGGVDLFKVPRHQLTKADKDKLFDSGGDRWGLVRGGTLRLLERQEYRYGRTTSEGAVLTNMGAAPIYNSRQYFYRVAYVKVLEAPAQVHMRGREGWIVLEKHHQVKGKWVLQKEADISPTLEPTAAYPPPSSSKSGPVPAALPSSTAYPTSKTRRGRP